MAVQVVVDRAKAQVKAVWPIDEDVLLPIIHVVAVFTRSRLQRLAEHAFALLAAWRSCRTRERRNPS